MGKKDLIIKVSRYNMLLLEANEKVEEALEAAKALVLYSSKKKIGEEDKEGMDKTLVALIDAYRFFGSIPIARIEDM